MRNAGSIPEAFRKETEDFKMAMAIQATAAAVARVKPAPVIADTNVRSVIDNTKKLMAKMEVFQRESGNQSGCLPECLMEYVTAVNQAILVVDPVRTPLLDEAIGNTEPDVAGFPVDLGRRGDMVDADMDFSEEGMCAMAVAIVEDIGSVTISSEKHFETVMGHLRYAKGLGKKGLGKGKPRPLGEEPYES